MFVKHVWLPPPKKKSRHLCALPSVNYVGDDIPVFIGKLETTFANLLCVEPHSPGLRKKIIRAEMILWLRIAHRIHSRFPAGKLVLLSPHPVCREYLNDSTQPEFKADGGLSLLQDWGDVFDNTFENAPMPVYFRDSRIDLWTSESSPYSFLKDIHLTKKGNLKIAVGAMAMVIEALVSVVISQLCH
jgi:hypothetical protein